MRNSRAGLNAAPLPKILGSGVKRTLGAAPVLDRAEALQRAVGRAARIALAIELLPARDLDLHRLRQRVRDRDADAVQAAARLIDLGVEFSARMQRGHDDFERGLLLEFRMRVDRDAAAVVGHGEEAVVLERDLDTVGMARHRLVHGVVEHLGEEVMHRLLVGAADIHAGAPAHRLQPLQHLDVGGGVGLLAAHATGRRRLACRGLIGFCFSSSSSLANRSRDDGGFAHGSFRHQRLHESLMHRERLLARTHARLFQEWRKATRSGDLAAADLGDGHDRGPRRHVGLEIRPARGRVVEGRGAAEALIAVGGVGGRDAARPRTASPGPA